MDDKHQIIVNAEAFGNGQDHDNLAPMIDSAKKNMQTIGKGNLAKCKDKGLDAYIPDLQFRKRDVRFAEQGRFKDGINPRKPVKKSVRNQNTFTAADFTWDEANNAYICPEHKSLNRKARAQRIRNTVYDMYHARESDCSVCPIRLKCLSKPETKSRYLLIPVEHPPEFKEKISLVGQMKAKIDTKEGRRIYGRRLAIGCHRAL